MRKIITLIFASALLLTACGENTNTQKDTITDDHIGETNKDETNIYTEIIKEIEDNIDNAFKRKNYSIDVDVEEGSYEVSVGFDARDDRFIESSWAGAAGLEFLESMKKNSSNLDENIKKYELIFYADDKETYSTAIDNTDKIEITELELVSHIDNQDIRVTQEDIEEFLVNEKQKEDEEREKDRVESKRLRAERKKEEEKAIKPEIKKSTVSNTSDSSFRSPAKKVFGDELDEVLVVEVEENLNRISISAQVLDNIDNEWIINFFEERVLEYASLVSDYNFEALYFEGFMDLQNQYGDIENKKVIVIELSKDTIDKINFDNFIPGNLSQVTDNYSVIRFLTE